MPEMANEWRTCSEKEANKPSSHMLRHVVSCDVTGHFVNRPFSQLRPLLLLRPCPIKNPDSPVASANQRHPAAFGANFQTHGLSSPITIGFSNPSHSTMRGCRTPPAPHFKSDRVRQSNFTLVIQVAEPDLRDTAPEFDHYIGKWIEKWIGLTFIVAFFNVVAFAGDGRFTGRLLIKIKKKKKRMTQEITTERGREIRIHVRVLLEWRHAIVSKWLQLSLPAGSTRQLTKQKYKNLNGNPMKFDDDPITSLAEKLNLQETRIFVMFLQNCVICQRQFLPHTHKHTRKRIKIHHQSIIKLSNDGQPSHRSQDPNQANTSWNIIAWIQGSPSYWLMTPRYRIVNVGSKSLRIGPRIQGILNNPGRLVINGVLVTYKWSS